MLTLPEIVQLKKAARREGVRSMFLTEFYDKILETAQDEKTSGYLLFDSFRSIEEYSTFSNAIQDIIDNTTFLQSTVVEVTVNAEDMELEVHYDLLEENPNYKVTTT